jgi:hypothetical protein
MKKTDAMANIQARADATLAAQGARSDQSDLFGVVTPAQPPAAQSAHIEQALATTRARSAKEDTRPAKVKPPKTAKPAPSVSVIPAKTKATPTKRDLKMVEASAEIAGARPDGDDLAWLCRVVGQTAEFPCKSTEPLKMDGSFLPV